MPGRRNRDVLCSKASNLDSIGQSLVSDTRPLAMDTTKSSKQARCPVKTIGQHRLIQVSTAGTFQIARPAVSSTAHNQRMSAVPKPRCLFSWRPAVFQNKSPHLWRHSLSRQHTSHKQKPLYRGGLCLCMCGNSQTSKAEVWWILHDWCGLLIKFPFITTSSPYFSITWETMQLLITSWHPAVHVTWDDDQHHLDRNPETSAMPTPVSDLWPGACFLASGNKINKDMIWQQRSSPKCKLEETPWQWQQELRLPKKSLSNC